jgi:hypothetical protein
MLNPKTILSKSFNTQFFEFIDKLIEVVPDKYDVTVSRTYFDTVRKANPTFLLKIWHFFISQPYMAVIESGDVSFFIEKDYTHDLRMMPNSEEVLSVIEKSIRAPIRGMNEAEKQNIHKYILMLSRIANNYMEKYS